MEGGAKNRFFTLIYMATSLNTMEVYYNDFTTEKTLLMTALQPAVKRRALCNCFFPKVVPRTSGLTVAIIANVS